MAKLEKGFLFLYDWLPAIENLPAKDVKILLLALIDFQRNGTPIPVFSNKKMESYARMIEPSIRRRLDGQRGGISKGSPPSTLPSTPSSIHPSTPTPKQSKSNTYSNTYSKAEQSKSDDSLNSHKNNENKIAFGEFSNVFLTKEERALLTDIYGESIAEDLIDNLSKKIMSKGYFIKDHYATILDWANKDGVKPQSEKSYDVEDFFQAALMRSYEQLEGD